MRSVVVLWAALAVPSVAAATEIDVHAGAEHLLWEEFDDSGGRVREENGTRLFVGVVGTNPVNPEWSSDFGGRFYSATVDFEGDNGQGESLVSDTDYNGYQLELGFQRYLGPRQQQREGVWRVRFALGTERWRRSVQDVRLASGATVEGFVQRFATNYVRLGAAYRRGTLWAFDIGARAPFNARAEMDGVDGEVTVKPEGQLSLYTAVEVGLVANWSLALNYDSYRFSKSDTEEGLYQPRSEQETFGAALHYRF